MIDKYTNYIKEKNNEEKLSITLKSNRDDLYSGWEINNITSTINNTYYKGELLNTIASVINTGINPQNIYVLSESFSIKQLYQNLEDGEINLSDEDGITTLYHLGNPTPLYPEKKIMLLSKVFQVYSKMYSYAKRNDIEFPKKQSFLNYMYDKLIIENEDIDLQKLIQSELQILNLQSTTVEIQKKDEKDKKEMENKIRRMISFLKDDFKTYNNLRQLIIIPEIIDENILNNKDNFHKYFTFTSTFNRLERPIVCVYDEENKKIRILCYDLIVRSQHNEENYRFLKTRSISQNSPMIINILLGVGYGTFLLNYIDRMILLYTAEKQKLQSRNQTTYIYGIEELERKISTLRNQRENDKLEEDVRRIEQTKTSSVQRNNPPLTDISRRKINKDVQDMEQKNQDDIQKNLTSNDIELIQLNYND